MLLGAFVFVVSKCAWKRTRCVKGAGAGRSHDGHTNLSIPAKLAFSCAVSFGKSSSISVAFADAIFSSSLPATPRLRAAAEAAAVSDTPHDFMGGRWEDQPDQRLRRNAETMKELPTSRDWTGRSVILAKSSRKRSLQVTFHTPHCTAQRVSRWQIMHEVDVMLCFRRECDLIISQTSPTIGSKLL